MKSMKQLALITVLGALTSAGMFAQTVNLRATIPFDFTAGQKVMPAGDYEIRGSGHTVTVSRLDGAPANAFVSTIGAVSSGKDDTTRLDFHRYGNTYFLAAIWNGFSRDGREVPQSKVEKELAKRVGTTLEATVLASKK